MVALRTHPRNSLGLLVEFNPSLEKPWKSQGILSLQERGNPANGITLEHITDNPVKLVVTRGLQSREKAHELTNYGIVAPDLIPRLDACRALFKNCVLHFICDRRCFPKRSETYAILVTPYRILVGLIIYQIHIQRS